MTWECMYDVGHRLAPMAWHIGMVAGYVWQAYISSNLFSQAVSV